MKPHLITLVELVSDAVTNFRYVVEMTGADSSDGETLSTLDALLGASASPDQILAELPDQFKPRLSCDLCGAGDLDRVVQMGTHDASMVCIDCLREGAKLAGVVS